MESAQKEKKGLFFRFISGVEVVGNKLPHPFYLFSILIVVAIILSVIFAGTSITYESASSSGAGAEMVTVTVKNLINKDTITYVTQNMYSIYYNFSPMMMMGLLMLSIGLAEEVGLFGAVIKRTIAGAKPAFVFAVVSFIAINANTASNAVFVAFAPFDDPQVALAIVVEKGGSGSELGAIAADILTYYFHAEETLEVPSTENTLIR